MVDCCFFFIFFCLTHTNLFGGFFFSSTIVGASILAGLASATRLFILLDFRRLFMRSRIWWLFFPHFCLSFGFLSSRSTVVISEFLFGPWPCSFFLHRRRTRFFWVRFPDLFGRGPAEFFSRFQFAVQSFLACRRRCDVSDLGASNVASVTLRPSLTCAWLFFLFDCRRHPSLGHVTINRRNVPVRSFSSAFELTSLRRKSRIFFPTRDCLRRRRFFFSFLFFSFPDDAVENLFLLFRRVLVP